MTVLVYTASTEEENSLAVFTTPEASDMQLDSITNDQLVSPSLYKFAACYLAGIIILGACFNGIVIFVVLQDNKLLTPMNAILLNLAVADSGIALLGNPLAFYNASNGSWMFGPQLCFVYGFCMSLFGICSIYNLSFLAYHRYKIICHPFSSACHMTWTTAKFSILGTWLTSFLVSSPPLVGWGSYDNEAANISCSINWDSKGPNPTSYIMFLFLVALGVPTIVIGYSYFNILHTLKRAKIMQRQSMLGSAQKAETHVTKMVFWMVVAFFVAWGPYAVFSLLIAFTDVKLSESVMIAPSLFAKSSACYNPVIYFFLNNQFRKSFLRRIQRQSSEDEISNDVKPIQLSRMKIRSEETGFVNLHTGTNHENMTATLNLSGDKSANRSSNTLNGITYKYRRRDCRLSQLFPYHTLPFTRKKSQDSTSFPHTVIP